MLVRSHYIAMVRFFIGLDIVKVITGIRRSGKSVARDNRKRAW